MTDATARLEEPRADSAEKAVLGISMMNDRAAAETVRGLKATDFYDPAHQAIFVALEALVDERKPTDAISLWAQVEANGDDRLVRDGAIYLTELFTLAPAAASLSHHVDLVKDAGARRELARLGALSQTMAGSKTSGSANAILETIRERLDSISASVVDSDIPTLSEGLEEALAEVDRIGREGAVVGIPTGFPELDAKLNGLRPGQMIMVAGRPAMGKSTIALDFARNAAFYHDKSVLFFSLEMSREEVIMRCLSAQARVELTHLQTGNVSEEEWERLARAHEKIANARIGIDDDSSTTIVDVRAKARRWQARYGLDLIVIDYLQLMNSHRRVESRQQEVSEISRNIKLIAKEFGVPVVALSQLNRGAESRTDKRPMLSDLRESGSLEQDSDVVMLVHREEVYNPEQRVGEGDIIIAKQRAGPTGVVPVVAQLHYSRFVPAAFSLDRPTESPSA